MKKYLFVFVFISACFMTTGVYCADKVITAAENPWAPFVDPDNSSGGLSMEIIKSAYATQGYKVEMNYVPWARAIEGVKKGDYDIIPAAWKTNKREKFLHFSNPYAANKIKFIKRKNDEFVFENLDSLTGKNVGIIRDYGYGEDFKKAENFKKDTVSKFKLNIKKLIAGRIDLTLEDEIVAKVKITKMGTEILDKVAFAEKPFSSEKLYVTSGLKNPDHKKIIESFNKGLKEIKENGKYDKIMEKYGIK